MSRGALVAIEGLDRTGKTTQTEYLLDHLNALGLQHNLIKFPQRETPIGKLINKYLTDKSFQLSDESAHLLFSANRWEIVDDIKKLLNSGSIVIMDRYVYSGVAYSSAKGLDWDWCLNPDRGLPKPDITIFLKFRDSENFNRDGFGDERYEVSEFQQKVKLMFEKFEIDPNWRNLYVDNKDKEQVAKELWDILEGYTNGISDDLNQF